VTARMRWVIRGLFILLAAGVVANATSEPALTALIHGLVATPAEGGPPSLLQVGIQFGARLTNKSGTTVPVPQETAAEGGAIRSAVIIAELQEPNGDWRRLFTSFWFGSPKDIYEPCAQLAPGGTTEIKGLDDKMVFPRSGLGSAGPDITIRFDLWLFCRQPDGTVPDTSVTTEPFSLKLPSEAN